ncbi:MAG: hypothetical protein U1A78_02030 [Polyangia bacterium]
MPRIALVAFPYYRTFAAVARYSEAAVLQDAFAARGAVLDVVDGACGGAAAAGADLCGYDAVLPLGCWGYHEDPDGFLAFIDRLVASGARLLNPPEVLRWNLDKSYLVALREAGVDVAELAHFPRGSRPDLAAEVARLGSSSPSWRYVLKPTISANSQRTRVAAGPPDAEVLALADEILARSGLLLQPFFDEIPQQGEWSLLFFGGELSHAVRKVPRPGDFRSQPDHGATVHRAEPPPELVAQARAAVRAAPGPLVYARVDGFVRDGRLRLVELELIEPCLFLSDADADAPLRFCDAVLAALRT